MKTIALRLMAVFAIVMLLGGPALSAHADTGASITAHPSIALRQTLEGTPQVEVVEPIETVLPATEPPGNETEPQETAAPVQAESTVAPTEPIETFPPTTEPVETNPPVTEEPTEAEFIFVFCHVSPDGSQETMRISINDPAGAEYIFLPGHLGGDAILLFPDDYWGECIAPSPTIVPPTEQPTQVTEVPTATATATAPTSTPTPTGTASETVVPGSPTPTATTDPRTPPATPSASPTATSSVTVPAETPTTAPTETTVAVTVTAPANTPTATMEPTSVSPEPPVQPTDPPTSPPDDNAQAPVQSGTSAIDPVTGLPVAGSGPRDPHPENTAIVSVLLMTAVALGYSAVRARRRGI